MTTPESRLDKIEGQLTPPQWSIRLADEQRQYPTAGDYLRAVVSKPFQESLKWRGFETLTKQASMSRLSAMKGGTLLLDSGSDTWRGAPPHANTARARTSKNEIEGCGTICVRTRVFGSLVHVISRKDAKRGSFCGR